MEIKNDEYVDKCLGDHITEEQSAAIARADFSELPIGSYWKLNVIKLRIMAHDQFYGYNDVSTHHVVVMADEMIDYTCYNLMNYNIGGYHATPVEGETNIAYSEKIINTIGYDHVLNHTHDITDSAGKCGKLKRSRNVRSWLINSYNVDGVKYEDETDYKWKDADKIQFPAFKYNPNLKKSRFICDEDEDDEQRLWWLGTPCSKDEHSYCVVNYIGEIDDAPAATFFNGGIRPASLIY